MFNIPLVALVSWLIASLFYAYQYVLRVMPNIMMDDIMLQFDVGASAFGQFSGIYYIGYSLMHLPIGIMLDRYGPRRVMSVCLLLAAAGLLPLIFASHWALPVAGRALIGIGSSAAILGLFKIVRMQFDERSRTLMLSLAVTIGLLGAIYAGAPLRYFCLSMGYQSVISALAAIGVLMAAITYWALPDSAPVQGESVATSLRDVLTNSSVIWTCIFAGLMVGPLEGFADVWGTTYFKQVYGLEPSLAASLPSMIFMGMCFGAPLLSYMAQKVDNLPLTIIGAGIAMTAIFALLLTDTWSATTITIAFIAVGICCSYQLLAILQATTYTASHSEGLTTAIANMIIMSFGYGFHTVIGTIVEASGGIQNPNAIATGMSVVPIGLAIGTGGFMLLWGADRRKIAVNPLEC